MSADLEDIVDSLYETYIAPFGDDWANRPVADILVRKPASAASFDGSAYWVVPRDYVPGAGLEGQLVEVSTLQGLGYGPGAFNDGETWAYDDAARRVGEFVSPNTGDIVLLANGPAGFQFGGAYRAQHGSLAVADSRVPVAFGYPGGSRNDTLLDKLALFLSASAGPDAHARGSGGAGSILPWGAHTCDGTAVGDDTIPGAVTTPAFRSRVPGGRTGDRAEEAERG